MTRTTVTGASDDLIEIDGQLREEIPHYFSSDEEKEGMLAFSDGTLLAIEYDSDGIWRVKRLFAGACEYTHEPGDVTADTNDVATLTGELRWCLYGVRGQYNPISAPRKRSTP